MPSVTHGNVRLPHSRARQALVLASEQARAPKHDYIGTEHILLGLAGQDEGVAARIVLDFGADRDTIAIG